jgi:molybdenum cofactor cytidylyltransferase
MTTNKTTPYRNNITIALLAAGASSRMGRHKLLLPLAGKPIIAWPILAACESRAGEILVILGRDASAVQEELPPGRYRTLINTAFEQGQGTSVALAASSVSREVAGLMVLLADQPFMDTISINLILLAAEKYPDHIIMGEINGHSGHPVYLPQRLFANLRTLSGDIGAREIIAKERSATLYEPLTNELAHLDVDTIEDYLQAQKMAHRLKSPPS